MMSRHTEFENNQYTVRSETVNPYKMVLRDSTLGRKIRRQLLTTGNGEGKYEVDSRDPNLEYWTYKEVENSIKRMPDGIYSLKMSRFEFICSPLKISIPQVRIPIDNDVIGEVKSFLANKKVFTDIGALYKRGYLLYGPPGTGKSTLIYQMIEDIIPENALIIYCKCIPDEDWCALFNDDPRLKVFIFEELTQIPKVGSDAFLSFMDGAKSVDNSLILATTNYADLLPANIIERPGRFDIVTEIKDTPTKVYQSLIELYCPDAKDMLNSKKELLTTAQLRELGLKCKLRGISAEQSYKALKDAERLAKKEFCTEKRSTIGFGEDDDY